MLMTKSCPVEHGLEIADLHLEVSCHQASHSLWQVHTTQRLRLLGVERVARF